MTASCPPLSMYRCAWNLRRIGIDRLRVGPAWCPQTKMDYRTTTHSTTRFQSVIRMALLIVKVPDLHAKGYPHRLVM